MDIQTAYRSQPTPRAIEKLGAGDWCQIEIKSDVGALFLSGDPDETGMRMETRNDGDQRVYGRKDSTGKIVEVRIIL